MRKNSNTMFITGGGSGIGKGLVEAFHGLPGDWDQSTVPQGLLDVARH